MSKSDVRKYSDVHFVCQRCYQALSLDESILEIRSDSSLREELTGPSPPLSETPDEPAASNEDEKGDEENAEEDNVIRQHIPPSRGLSTDGNGFTVIGPDLNTEKTDSLSFRLKVTSQLFDVMSAQSDIDHPLCEECTDTLLDQLDQQLRMTEDELKDYTEYMEKLQEQTALEEQPLEEELAELRKEEARLAAKLSEVEEQRQNVAAALAKEKEEAKKLEQEEKQYWLEFNDCQRHILQLEDEQASVDNQLRYAQMQLDKLKKTNVFNSTFHIWHKGHFGTINNFRLGRLPSVPVEWSEINAAWGQTVLLLHSLAQKMNLTFERYRLVPFGNHSYLESLSDKSKELPLHGSGGFKFFWDTKFDQAMVAFLDCLQQFKEAVERVDKRFCLPYRMEKGKIIDSGTGGSFSVKIQFNSEEHWTKALKFMLTNLKWGLAWVSSQFTDK